MSHRFFIPSDWLNPPLVHLHGETARQIKAVLRMRPGDEIIVLDNSGTEWQVSLTDFSRESVQGKISGSRPARGEPALELVLYQGALKAQKFEWVLQKGTEVGISSFVPTLCHRSIITRANDLAKKQPRWQRIIQEAAEQSRRGKLPKLADVRPLPQALEEAARTGSLLLMPWEEATGPSLKQILQGNQAAVIALFIGPEGGFTEEEANMAQGAGAHLVKLGPRILRAETAGLAAASVILYEKGEWD